MNFVSQAELDATIRLRDFFHLFYFASYLVRTIFWSVPILVAITFWSVQLFGLYQFDEWNHLVRTSFHCIYIWSVPTLTSILGGWMVRTKINGRINGTDQNLVRTKSALRSKIGTNQNMVQTKNYVKKSPSLKTALPLVPSDSYPSTQNSGTDLHTYVENKKPS